MISLISVGVTRYPLKENLEDILCAEKDARNIYETFKKVLKSSFNEYKSICLLDIKQNLFENFLTSYVRHLENDDLIIIYYSGHGESLRDTYYLNFYDSEEESYMISTSTIKEILSQTQAHALVILDSCFSGSGLNLANGFVSSYCKSKISVLVSAEKYTPSQFTEKGSVFTEGLCRALEALVKVNETITLKQLVDEINSYNIKCLCNMEEGESDVFLLNHKKTLDRFSKSFIDSTMLKLTNNPSVIKEMLWYSILDLPSFVKEKIKKRYLAAENNKNEGSWLVRKAIGNFLCSCNAPKSDFDGLINSANWMEICIGLNALKYQICEDIASRIKSILQGTNYPMSLIWLANLYLIDSEYSDLKISLKSNMAKTKWGLYDIYTRFRKKGEAENSSIIHIIEENISDNSLLKYIYLDNDTMQDEYWGKLKQSNLYKDIEQSSTERGRLGEQEVNKKWLMSILYGSWRDYIHIDLNNYLMNTSSDIIKEELELSQYFFKIEIKISILSFFESHEDYFNIYKEQLKWSLEDEHPWVNNIAIGLYRDHIEKILDRKIDRKLYPGVLDLFITARNNGLLVNPKYHEMYKLTLSEIKSLT